MRYRYRAMIGLAGVAFLLIAGPAIAADEPEIVVEVGATEIFAGESVDYVVEIRNVQDPSRPDLRRCARISMSSPPVTSRIINRPH